MKSNIYVIKDKAADSYCPPFLAKNHFVARRSFDQFVSGIPDHVPSSDFEIYQIGTFDDDSAEIISLTKFELVNFHDGGSQ